MAAILSRGDELAPLNRGHLYTNMAILSFNIMVIMVCAISIRVETELNYNE